MVYIPEIKFSHHYPKLCGQKTAELIDIRILDALEVQINKDLIEYDTKYEHDYDCYGDKEDCECSYYPLPKTGKLIQLIFLGDKNIPFCTLRPFTEEKWTYYNNFLERKGIKFNIIIEGD